MLDSSTPTQISTRAAWNTAAAMQDPCSNYLLFPNASFKGSSISKTRIIRTCLNLPQKAWSRSLLRPRKTCTWKSWFKMKFMSRAISVPLSSLISASSITITSSQTDTRKLLSSQLTQTNIPKFLKIDCDFDFIQIVIIQIHLMIIMLLSCI